MQAWSDLDISVTQGSTAPISSTSQVTRDELWSSTQENFALDDDSDLANLLVIHCTSMCCLGGAFAVNTVVCSACLMSNQPVSLRISHAIPEVCVFA